MTKPYGENWRDKKSEEEKNYYLGAEKALRNVRHDSSKTHSPSIETSTPQKRPYNNNDGCRRIFVLCVGFLIAVGSILTWIF